jgi:hypothetical protein
MMSSISPKETADMMDDNIDKARCLLSPFATLSTAHDPRRQLIARVLDDLVRLSPISPNSNMPW